MKFVFKTDNSTEVTAFTDRPNRLMNRLPRKKFAKSFDTIFADDKPNASLTHWYMEHETLATYAHILQMYTVHETLIH